MTTFPPTQAGFQQSDRSRTGLHSWLDACIDGGLMVSVFVVPFVFGGRSSIGQLILTGAAFGMAAAWLLRQLLSNRPLWNWTGLEIPILLLTVWVTLQLVHWPPEWVGWVSPKVNELLPAWGASSTASLLPHRWDRLTLAPALTRSALATLVSVALVALVAVQRIQTRDDAFKLLRWIALSAVLMAALGILQFSTNNGKFFWLIEHPYSTTADRMKGAFTNKNHFAHFLVLAVGPLVWWGLSLLGRHGQRREAFQFGTSQQSAAHRFTAVVVGLALVIAAVCFSMSRGGVVALTVALVFLLVALERKGVASGKLLALLAGSGVLCLLLLSMFGTKKFVERLDNWQSDDRLKIWKTNIDMAADFPITGIGLASHRDVYPAYLDQPFDNREFTHTENCYLQVTTELGFPGLAVVLAGIMMCVYWVLAGLRLSESREGTLALAAVGASLMAHLTHAAVDFVWYVPGCMVVVAVLVACAARLYQFARAESAAVDSFGPDLAPGAYRAPRWAVSALLLVLLAGAAWAVRVKLPPALAEPDWLAYLRMIHDDRSTPDSTDVGSGASRDELQAFRRKLLTLRRVVLLDPSNARAQLRMAAGYLAWFDLAQQHSSTPMDLLQIRDAAWNGGFADSQQLSEWLNRVLGSNRRYLDRALQCARQAVKEEPLLASGYVHLARLSFLHGGSPESRSLLLSQAQTARPFEPHVLFELGREAWLAGRFPEAIKLWRNAFHRSRFYQQRILDLLVGAVPARLLIQTFQPDLVALKSLRERYARAGSPDDRRAVLTALAQALVQEARSPETRQPVAHWLEAATVWEGLGEAERTQECYVEALRAAPNSFHVHRLYGAWLFRQQRYAEAAEHLQQALRLRPQDQKVRLLAERANRLKLQTAGLPPSWR